MHTTPRYYAFIFIPLFFSLLIFLGKYGIIREQDFFLKQREFEAYMNEVKKQPGIMGQGRVEVMKAFQDFIEDYNTATMPDEKFYNYEKWETMDYKRKKMAEVQGGVQRSSSNEEGFYNAADDEANRKAELKRKKEEEEKKEFNKTIALMAVDTERQERMKSQQKLQTELHLAYKSGNTKAQARIERLLAPDVVKAVKHPWAK